jgi:hypothetical protein
VATAGSNKRALARELRRAEGKAFASALDASENALNTELAARLADGRAPTLFGERRGLDADLRRELNRLRAARRDVRAARRRFSRDNELPWFHYQSQFADVFADGGFDVVVGNPPWVRAEALPPERRALLAARYPWWRSGGRGFSHRPDLSLAFLARAWELVRPGGVVGFLLPAKLATAEYGARARHALAATGTIRAAADLTAAPEPIFDGTVYPLALVVSKSSAPEGHRVRTRLGPPRAETTTGVPQQDLIGGKRWPPAPRSLRCVLWRSTPVWQTDSSAIWASKPVRMSFFSTRREASSRLWSVGPSVAGTWSRFAPGERDGCSGPATTQVAPSQNCHPAPGLS